MTWNRNWPENAAANAFDGDQPPAQQPVAAPMASAGNAAQQPAVGFHQSVNAAQQPMAARADQEQPAQAQQPAAVPPVDVVESADELVVRIDVPGFEKDELELQADANRLYVTGNRSRELDDDEQALLTERPTRVERTIPLSVDIDPEEVTASHENGVCEVVVPKDAQTKRHEIGFQ